MEVSKSYEIHIDTLSTIAPSILPPVFHITPQATQVGFFENLNSPTIDACKDIAVSSDASIIFTSNNFEFESESFDRKSFKLPLGQDDLITHVAAVAKKKIMINQTGSGITMPWLNPICILLQN
jgi:beta-glucosidase